MDQTTAPYEAPTLKLLGGLHELTLLFNKNGGTPDIYSEVVPVIGDLVSVA